MTDDEPDWTHALNTFASPTPVLDDQGRLFCHFGRHGTACLDTKTQKLLWTNQDLRIKHENGPGSSPVLWKNRLIVHFDGSDTQFVAAYDTGSGRIAWKVERSGELNSNPQLKKAYGTPLIVEMNGKEVVASPGADWLYFYDPATGKELSKVEYGVLGFSIVPRPVAGDGTLFICTSFMKSELLAVRYESVDQPQIQWRYRRQVPQKPSPLLVDGLLYMVSDSGIATCLDAKNGEEVWVHRLGGNYSASPLFADGKLYFSNHEGLTTVIAPGREFQQLGTGKLPDGIMASPAALDDQLYVRTTETIYRIEQK